MASAVGISGTISNPVSDDERRWVVVGICLTKVLTPALRDVVANEIPIWYQTLLPHPDEIDKQTFGKHKKSLPPSALKLNYDSINNNFTNHKSSVRKYDYSVKDAISLAKLLMKPFMAGFTGFDDTMDTSAALSVVAEAQPFHASGASGMAKKVRSDIRNEWAHCDFAHWTDVIYQTALKDMEKLINGVNLTPAKKKKTLDDLDGWKKKGLDLCFGQLIDSELLELVKTEVAELRDSVNSWKEDSACKQSKLLQALERINESFNLRIQHLKERQLRTEQDVEQLRFGQLALYETISRESQKEPRYLFMAPKQTMWFSGRQFELGFLRNILENENNTNCTEKVTVAAVSGLGGCGKTSLTLEYLHKWKEFYQGGVYWLSGENEITLKASVDDVAAHFNTLNDDDSLDATLSKTLAVFSRITKPWLLVIDDMDEYILSPSLLKLLSGSWQANVAFSSHLIITTRRTPQELEDRIPGFKESDCLILACFGFEETKKFVYKRTGIIGDEQTDLNANILHEKLGGLPLALEQACAYIKYLGCTLTDYLEAYEKQSLQLLDKKKASSSHGTSQERLAVRTTWLLNFEYIRKDRNGEIAIRFLNASAFLNPNEIQKELINIGKPCLNDKAYCDYVSSSLGSREVLKLLTDFSLFREALDGSISVHRLVQEVILENLNPEEKVESIVDAARLLSFAFSTIPSPDSTADPDDRPSLRQSDPSRFYLWHKFCLHAHEIKMNLERLLDIISDVKEKDVFLPEVARIVYEYALYLNVNNSCSQAKTAADFATRILGWGNHLPSTEGLTVLFPHFIPLSEPLRRLIQYSCKAPPESDNLNSINTSANASLKSEIKKMRLEGNSQFKKSNFQEAIEIYTSCIDKSKRKESFDVRLLSNRASAYLRLMQYENALGDAEEYIKYSPECPKGFARKALALHGLNKRWEALSAAALAFYHDRDIFNKYEPFKTTFPNLKESIYVCDDELSLVYLLTSEITSKTKMPGKIIMLEAGEYHLSTDLKLDNIIIVGVGVDVTLSFSGNFGLYSTGKFMADNISFIFEDGRFQVIRESDVQVSKCSITSNNDQAAFMSEGTLNVKKTRFINCKGNALWVTGKAVVENCEFSGNELVGLKVMPCGNLWLKDSKLHGNRWGLDVHYGKCAVTGCQIYDNKTIGVGVGYGKAKLARNELFHNDRHGVFIFSNSRAVIEENEIFENGLLGIQSSDSYCRVFRNKIYKNKSGGVHLVPVARNSGKQESIVESNHIFSNEGPAIDQARAFDDEIGSVHPSSEELLAGEEDFIKARCTENKLENNVEEENDPPSPICTEICFCCLKKGKLKKCGKCFSARYCNLECQRKDWKKHKNNCVQLLKKRSVLVKVHPLSSGLSDDEQVTIRITIKAPCPWLEESGPEYAHAPKPGEQFIVKIQACDSLRRSNDGNTLFSIEDRSLSINGSLDMQQDSGRIYHLVRECGWNCYSFGWKKKFFWALLGNEENFVRLFVKDFPTYQRW